MPALCFTLQEALHSAGTVVQFNQQTWPEKITNTALLLRHTKPGLVVEKQHTADKASRGQMQWQAHTHKHPGLLDARTRWGVCGSLTGGRALPLEGCCEGSVMLSYGWF